MKLLTLLLWATTNAERRQQLRFVLGIWRGAAYLGREQRLFLELMSYMDTEKKYVERTMEDSNEKDM